MVDKAEVPTLDPYLVCQCRLCTTWRRIGTVIAAGHREPDFHEGALGILRQAFNEILDHKGGNFVGPVAPVAVGEAGHQVDKAKDQKADEEPAAPRGEPGERATEKSRHRKEHKKEDRGEGKARKRKKSREASEQTEDPPVKRSHSRKGKRAHSKEASSRTRSTLVKEESEGEDRSPVVTPDAGEEKGSRKEKKRRETPSRTRTRSPEENPTSRGSRGETERGSPGPPEAPPGQWVLRPRSPAGPPPPRRPREPDHPPSWWYQNRQERTKNKERSKGVVKKLRNSDIKAFGTSSERKKLREEGQR